MASSVRDLIGSPLRDSFNWWHKQPPASKDDLLCDVDCVLIDHHLGGFIAFLDIKRPGEGITRTEVWCYEGLRRACPTTPLFFVIIGRWGGQPKDTMSDITIRMYTGIDTTLPDSDRSWDVSDASDVVTEHLTRNGYVAWESELRRIYTRAGIAERALR